MLLCVEYRIDGESLLFFSSTASFQLLVSSFSKTAESRDINQRVHHDMNSQPNTLQQSRVI